MKDKQVFHYIYKHAAPLTKSAYQFGEQSFDSLFIQVSGILKKSYQNSSPEDIYQEEALSFSASAASELEESSDSYTPEEKEALKRILQDHNL
ncbi:hypothetical protein HBN50_15650 [Halobacteriovorax sp. GB3]|uniref:hypothetical protein n=1 Tax=Halobacteriovorax sp. GB3 TaxID=2719615 RepID=UPI0023607ED4|nr:hypothetical protein [Halobacteriovorax sp. GB3]MDD0854546.1 hypothetical protein [Halobacteriovorax sp. GB3]